MVDSEHQEEYWRRRDIVRQWAEEIRDVVLHKGEDNVERIFQGLSTT